MRRALQALLEDAGAAWQRAASWVASRVPGLWVLAALLLLPTYDLFNVEMNLYDAQVNVRHLLARERPAMAPAITVVAIDDAARRTDAKGRLNRMQPLSRAYLAELVDRLVLLQPSVIVFDVFFDLPADTAADDAALLAALHRAREHGIGLVAAARLASMHMANLPVLPIDAYLDALDLVGHASLAATASDKVVRHGMVALQLLAPDDFWMARAAGLVAQLPRDALFEPSDAESGGSFWFWSLAAAALARHDKSLRPALRRLRSEPPFLIDFSLPPEQAYAQRSAADVMADAVERLEVERGIVLVGAGFEGSSDRHPTPLSSSSLRAGKFKLRSVIEDGLHGVQVQAYALRALSERLAPHAGRRAWPEGALTGASFAAGLLVSGVAHRRQSERPTRWWLLVVMGAGYILFCVVAYQVAQVYVPMSRPVTALALAFGLSAACTRWWAARTRPTQVPPAVRFMRKRSARNPPHEARNR